MITHITVPLPEPLRDQIRILMKENFYLWIFISQNDLWEDARAFLQSCNTEDDDAENLPFTDEQ